MVREYLFFDFILNTLTFSSLKSSRTFNSTVQSTTTGVPTLISFPSSSETSRGLTFIFDQILAF